MLTAIILAANSLLIYLGWARLSHMDEQRIADLSQIAKFCAGLHHEDEEALKRIEAIENILGIDGSSVYR